MKPFNNRTPDTQYRDLLKKILENGIRTNTQQETDAITLMAPGPMHFKFENGFPMITERNMAPKTSDLLPVTVWQQAVGEIFAFINGVRTQKGLEEFGCTWWSSTNNSANTTEQTQTAPAQSNTETTSNNSSTDNGGAVTSVPNPVVEIPAEVVPTPPPVPAVESPPTVSPDPAS
jgi:thymidylate synthase